MRAADTSSMNFEELIGREWLVTNGLGGYANSTVSGLNTRKYHGLLVAAMSPPVRRMVLLAHADETVTSPKGAVALSSNEYPGAVHPQGYRQLRAFSVEPFPRWAFQGDGFTIEKSLRMVAGQNTVCLTYTLLGGDQDVTLDIRPLLALRGIHELMYQWNGRTEAEQRSGGQIYIPASARSPELFFAHDGEFHSDPFWYLNTIYRREQERGYAGLEDLWNPGTFRWRLSPGKPVNLVCSTEPVELEPVREALRIGTAGTMSGAIKAACEADSRVENLAKAAAIFPVHSKDATPYVIADYPWSPPNVRATLIGFEGLLLIPGRFDEAKRLLLNLAGFMQDGVVPTEFPESGDPPRCAGADTSLWFVDAVRAYLEHSGDDETVRTLFPAIVTILQAYQRGTGLGIKCDSDGLVSSSSADLATSWMDAKIGDFIVTPRAGRTVEINALWFNALRVGTELAVRFDKPDRLAEFAALSERVLESFNRRFWNAERNCCFDVVGDGGNDGSIRPNQIFAISLAHPVLRSDRREAVVRMVIDKLLTGYGVRTLSPSDPAYRGNYAGAAMERDRAQHQGTVYPWLLGALAMAYERVYGRNAATSEHLRKWLAEPLSYLEGPGFGNVCEMFDGNPPHAAGGAIASALSAGCLLACYVQNVLGIRPDGRGGLPSGERAKGAPAKV